MTRPPPFTPCPQCTSRYCGAVSCRFSGITHKRAAELAKENAYANAGVKRDQAQRLEGRPEHDTTTTGRPLKGAP